MGKKKRAPEAPTDTAADLIAARVLVEQDWAYAQWVQHATYQQMRVRVSEPPPRGLGYDLSLEALRGLVAGYRARAGDLAMTREEHRERELHDLDILQQEAARAMLEARQNPPVDAQGNIMPFALNAAKLFADLGEKRRKLLGLDEPVKVEADVTHRDAVMEELDAMMTRAGMEVDHE